MHTELFGMILEVARTYFGAFRIQQFFCGQEVVAPQKVFTERTLSNHVIPSMHKLDLYRLMEVDGYW